MSFSSPSKRTDESGMTILEVLISMAILVFISFQLYQASTKLWEIRAKLIDEGDFFNGIRMAMGIVERDVSMIYNPAISLPVAKASPTPGESQELEQMLNGDEGRQSAFWGPAVDRTGVRSGRFVGTDTKLTFVAVSHVRVYKEARESEFAKITYELRDGTLVKTENSNAFDTDDKLSEKSRATFPLLSGITKMHYRYYRKSKEEWVTRWDSDSTDFKDQYPDIIEATLEVKGPSRLTFDGIYKMRPEIPLRGIDPST